MRMAAHTSQVQIPPSPAAAQVSRHWILPIAAAMGANTSALSVIELLVSEIVTNAVKYGHVHDTIDVAVQRSGDLITVTVRDNNPSAPQVRNTGPLEPGGRGMHLVTHLAHTWGTNPQSTGKSVWFTVHPTAT